MVFSIALLVLFIIEIISFFVINHILKKRSIRKVIKVLVSIGIVLLEIVTVRFMFLPPTKQIETTGKYSAVCTDYWVKNQDETKEVQVRKWYPEGMEEGLSNLPVVVASHGSCGTIDNNVSLYKELASYGYVVIAVGHAGYASSVTMSDGTEISVSSEFIKEMISISPQEKPEEACNLYKKWMKNRVEDLNLVMDDYLTKYPNVEFISLGHSAGGSSAYAIARDRKDVVAVIALESPFMGDARGVENGEMVFDESSYDIPMLNVYSDASYSKLNVWNEYKENADLLLSDSSDVVNIYYEGIYHMGLCDLSLESPLLAAIIDGHFPKVDANTLLTKLNRDVMGFLNEIDF